MDDFLKQDFSKISTYLNELNPYEFTLVASLLGFIIAPTLTLNQQNAIGSFFQQLGQVLVTINAQATTVDQYNKRFSSIEDTSINDDIYTEVENLKKEIISLRKDLLSNDYFK